MDTPTGNRPGILVKQGRSSTAAVAFCASKTSHLPFPPYIHSTPMNLYISLGRCFQVQLAVKAAGKPPAQRANVISRRSDVRPTLTAT